MTLLFAELIAPFAETAFYRDHLGKTPLHVEGGADKFKSIMSWETLTALVNQAGIWTSASLLLVLDREPVAPAKYCFPGVTREGRQGLLVDLDKVGEFLKRGATIVLNDMETLTSELSAVAAALENGPGGMVQGNLYCSRKERQGFASHFDTHDVYAVHIAGEKTWRIYQRHFDSPINHPAFKTLGQAFHESHKGAISQEVTLEPGDLLYIPRGYYHDAVALTPGTIHIAFQVVPMIGLDVVTQLFERAVHDVLFRKSMPPVGERGGKAVEDHVEALAKRLGELGRDPAFVGRIKEAMRTYRFRRSRLKLPIDS